MIAGDGWKPVAPDDDALLVQRAREGDAGAFGLLYERYHDRLCRVARQYLRSPEDANDAAHDTFAKFMVALREGRYTHRGRLDSFLCLACQRVALDMVRKLAYRSEHRGGLGQKGDHLHLLAENGHGRHDDEAPDAVLAEEQRHAISRLIEALPEKEATALTLCGAGMTMRQAARHLNTTIPAIKARLWRARAAAEVLIAHDPRFDAIRPEDMRRRRLKDGALLMPFRSLLKGDDRRAHTQHRDNAEELQH